MRILVAAVGRKPPPWAREGYAEYARRLPARLNLNLIEVTPVARSGSLSVEAAKRREADRIGAVIPRGTHLLALDERGESWSSAELAVRLERWMQNGRDVTMLVGGADGLDAALVESADQVWSLSKLTLPHAFVPVLIAEQLYRAWSLLHHHPYHRA